MKKTPHQRIMAADRKGTGLRLSADEVHRLAQDDAIRQAAEYEEPNTDCFVAERRNSKICLGDKNDPVCQKCARFPKG